MTDIVHYIVYIALHKKHNYVWVCQTNTKVDTLIEYGCRISIPIVSINKTLHTVLKHVMYNRTMLLVLKFHFMFV